MCLTVDNNYPVQPDGSIRYKMLVNSGGFYLCSPYSAAHFKFTTWKVGELKSINKDVDTNNINSQGFHVFLSLEDAARIRLLDNDILFRCECNGFVAGGTCLTESTSPKSEIWREVKILEEVKCDLPINYPTVK